MYKTYKISNNASTSMPRGVVILNGLKVPFLSIEVEQNGFSAADTFSISCPWYVGDNKPANDYLAANDKVANLFLTKDSIESKVFMGYPKSLKYDQTNLKQLIDGFIDTIKWNFDSEGEKVALTGRNIVGKMIDTKIVDKYPNKTSSAIARIMATKYGLTPVITNTSTLSGKYYNNTSTLNSATETTEWDLLLFLAQQEGFIVRVKGDYLLFGPFGTMAGYESTTPYKYTWGQNIIDLEIERSPQAAKDLVVKVITYARGSKTHIVETARSNTQKATGTGQVGRRQKYIETYTIPGLTRQQAQQKARSIYNELSRAEIIGQMTIAGNPDLSIDTKIALDGVGYGLSTQYYINKIIHSFDADNGYECQVSFGNQLVKLSEESQ